MARLPAPSAGDYVCAARHHPDRCCCRRDLAKRLISGNFAWTTALPRPPPKPPVAEPVARGRCLLAGLNIGPMIGLMKFPTCLGWSPDLVRLVTATQKL